MDNLSDDQQVAAVEYAERLSAAIDRGIELQREGDDLAVLRAEFPDVPLREVLRRLPAGSSRVREPDAPPDATPAVSPEPRRRGRPRDPGKAGRRSHHKPPTSTGATRQQYAAINAATGKKLEAEIASGVLSPKAGALARHMFRLVTRGDWSRHKGYGAASLKWWARETGFSVSTVQRVLREILERSRCFVKQRGGTGHASHVFLALDGAAINIRAPNYDRDRLRDALAANGLQLTGVAAQSTSSSSADTLEGLEDIV